MTSVLYKRDTTGNIRQWSVELNGSQYRTIAGVQFGQMVTSEWTCAEAKNLGKKNELSAEQQALKEVQAMYVKKGKEGYVATITDIDALRPVRPMLALKYPDHFTVSHQPFFCQPKLDGIRCIARADGLWTRKGERIVTCGHIEVVLVPICQLLGIEFDGELYNHEYRDNFNKIQSLITKRVNVTAEDIEQVRQKVQYHIYDFISTDLNFSNRNIVLKDLFNSFPQIATICQKVPTVQTDYLQIKENFDWFVSNGYEGQMIRLDEPYQPGKRSKFLLKHKEMMDEEFLIVSIDEGEGNRSGMAGRVTCRLPDGRLFGAGIKGGTDLNKHMLENAEQYEGKWATIIFQNYTPDGVPRFPVFKCIRED